MTTLPADVSATQLADILGIGRRAVADLDKAGTLAKNGAGRFPLAPAIAAYIASRLAAARRDPGDTFKDQYAAERARKLRIETICATTSLCRSKTLRPLLIGCAAKSGMRCTALRRAYPAT